MRGRPPCPNGFSFTPGRSTNSARSTKARPPWTGWNRNRNAASPSPPPPPPVFGKGTSTTSSIPPATWISRPKWSARFACLMGEWSCSTAFPAWSPNPKPCGARPTNTMFPACASSTSSTAWGPASRDPSKAFWTVCPTRPRPSNTPLASNQNSRGSSIWSP